MNVTLSIYLPSKMLFQTYVKMHPKDMLCLHVLFTFKFLNYSILTVLMESLLEFKWDCYEMAQFFQMASRLSLCPVHGSGTAINPHCSMLPSTARLPPNNRVHGPLRNSPDAKGHTASSCHPLSPSSSHLPSPPLCRLLSTYFLTAGANRLPLLPPPPPMRSGNLSLEHWRTPPRWPPSAHQRNGFWQP